MGEFLTIRYCFPYYFLEIFVGGGDKALIEGDKVMSKVPPLGKVCPPAPSHHLCNLLCHYVQIN